MKFILPVLLLATALIFAETDETSEPEKTGGSFFISPSFMNLDMSPVKELAGSEILTPYSFDMGKSSFSCNGLGAYWGRKNAFRGGLALFGGYRRYQSDPAARTLLNDNGDTVKNSSGVVQTADSIMNLYVVPLYLGFLFDRSKSLGAFNIYGGGLIGGGVLMVVKNGEASSEKSAFMDNGMGMNDTLDMDPENTDGHVAVAPMSVAELHAGATYSLARWFHVGAEGYVTAFISGDGFINGRNGSFTTFNPGLRLRLILGNLG